MSELLQQTIYQEDLYQVEVKPVAIIDKPWALLNDSEQALLIKIIDALKLRVNRHLSFGAFRVLHFEEKSLVPWPYLRQALVFADWSGELEKFEVLQIENCDVIFANSLTALQADEQARQKLWAAMQKMFRK